MKKVNLLLGTFILLICWSCQEDLDVVLDVKENVITRNAGQGFYYEEEQPVYKLLDMPVYIINRGNSNGAYLTANSDYSISLEPLNSNKMQRWIIDSDDRTLSYEAGGDSDCDALVQYGVYSFEMTNSKKYLGLKEQRALTPCLIDKDNANKLHQWRFRFRMNSSTINWFQNGYMRILQPKYLPWWEGYLASRSSTLSFLDGNLGVELWEIQPTEHFKLNKLTWSLEAEDVIKTLPAFIDQVSVNNNSAVTANMTVSFTRKASETSTFTKSVGSEIRINTSAKIGLPIIASGKIDITNTTTANWQWGNNESHEDTRAYSFNMVVPPYTSVTAKIMVQMSQLSATYVADFEGEMSGRKLRFFGKWEGVQAGNIYYEILDNKTKAVLSSFNGVPKSTVVLNTLK